VHRAHDAGRSAVQEITNPGFVSHGPVAAADRILGRGGGCHGGMIAAEPQGLPLASGGTSSGSGQGL
jgi:hypothetical protein